MVQSTFGGEKFAPCTKFVRGNAITFMGGDRDNFWKFFAFLFPAKEPFRKYEKSSVSFDPCWILVIRSNGGGMMVCVVCFDCWQLDEENRGKREDGVQTDDKGER